MLKLCKTKFFYRATKMPILPLKCPKADSLLTLQQEMDRTLAAAEVQRTLNFKAPATNHTHTRKNFVATNFFCSLQQFFVSVFCDSSSGGFLYKEMAVCWGLSQTLCHFVSLNFTLKLGTIQELLSP